MKKRYQRFFDNDSYLASAILGLSAVFFVYMALTAKSDCGGADSYWHYYFTHYAFQKPELFLDHWGKPLFIALSAPFSYFGYFGLQVFNIVVSLSSAFLVWRLGKKLGLKFAWLGILLTLYAPVYFPIVFSGLTENLFGLVMILAVYLFFDKKYAASALVISFIPYARTEGLMIIPLFALALAWQRKWPHILLLFTGFLFYSIVGYFHFHDFWWFFTRNPYAGSNNDIYGHGSLWHFAAKFQKLFGIAFTCLLLIGSVELLSRFIPKRKKPLPIVEVLLILLPVMLYFGGHSYAWWKGGMASAGLLRVISAIIPVAAVLAIMGFNVLLPLVNRKKIVVNLVLIAVSCLIMFEMVLNVPLPYPNSLEEQVFDKVLRWIEKEKPIGAKLWVLNPYLAFKLNLNPFDKQTVGLNFPLPEELVKDTRPGDLMVWDAHFGPDEGHTPLPLFMDNKFFELLAEFGSDDELFNAHGVPFEIYVFRRTLDTNHPSNAQILEDLKRNSVEITTEYLNTFDTTGIYADDAKTNACFRMKKDIEFVSGMEKLVSETNYKEKDVFEMSVDIWPLHNDAKAFMQIVAAVSHEDDYDLYKGFEIKFRDLEKNKWNTRTYKIKFPDVKNSKARFSVYLWNLNNTEAYIDNLKVNLIRQKNQ